MHFPNLIKRNEEIIISKYEIITKKQIEDIHDATLEVLEKTGVVFHYQPALEIFCKAGAKVDGNRVYFPNRLVEEQVKKAPSHFTLNARNPENNVIVGGDNIVFIPGYGAPYVSDLDKGRRMGTLEDYVNFAKLAAASQNQDLVGGILIEPNDIPINRRHVEMAYACLKNSDKCFMGSANGEKNAKDIINMVSIVFGDEWNFAEKPALISLINSMTPLSYDESMLGALMEHAKAGQAVIIAALAMAGSTAPVTLAGALVCQNAEVLAGVVLTQLIREGAPVVYGASSSIADMSNVSLSIGAPEMAILSTASIQLANYYEIPCKGGRPISDSKMPDAQSGYESMMGLSMANASGTHVVLHSAGILESYNLMSYEKFIIDDEICGMVKRIRRGFEVNKDTLALELIDQVGPGGHFVDKEHTCMNFRKEHYQPTLSNRDNYSVWKNKGSYQIMEAANKRFKDILKAYQAPSLET